MKKPNFFIIGAPKCGTTSLAAWLAEHPNIYMSPLKEPHFYATDLGKYKVVNRDEYEALFKEAKSFHLAVGEASVFYLFSKDAIPKIEREYSEAKYIVMLRNPVEMAYSLHEQLLVSGDEHIRDFAKAWRLSSERRQGKKVMPWCREPKILDYQSICKLGEQMERLLNIVPRQRILVLLLDDIKNNPRREYLKVLNFLGVPDDERLHFPVKNTAKGVRWPYVQTLIRGLRESWASLRGLLRIPSYIGRIGILSGIMKRNIVHRPRPPLDSELRQEMINYFRDDIEKLSFFD